MNKRTTAQLTIDAMLAAMCVVLGFASIRIGNAMKVSLEAVPVILAGLMFGPLDGALVGFVGIFLYQFLSYGITATTLLWVLPFVVVGFLSGVIAKKSGFNNNGRQLIWIFLAMELVVMCLNTFSIYVDSKIYHYYTPALITAAFVPRLLVAVAKGILLGILSKPLLKQMSRFTLNGR